MHTIRLLATLLLLQLSHLCYGQFATWSIDVLTPIRPAPRYTLSVPSFSEPTNRFAYTQITGSVQTLKLARIEANGLSIEARDLATLQSHDLAGSGGVLEEVEDLLASPQNDHLAVLSVQEYFGFNDAFMDHNVHLYSMEDGTHRGLINEHSFAGLNKSIVPSQRLEEFKQAEVDMGVPQYVVDTYDYYVGTEGVIPYGPTYQWNDDGTFTYSIELEVFFADGVGYQYFIGTEVFTKTFAINTNSITALGYNLAKTEASLPATHSLGPGDVYPAATATVSGWTIQFIIFEFYYNGRRYVHRESRDVHMTAGNLPRTYSTISF